MALRYDEPEAGPPVATDRDPNDDNFQVVKCAFGAGGSPAEAERVERSVPLPARDYHGGSVPFDSGPLPIVVGSPATALSSVSIWVDLLLLVNLTGQDQRLSISDGAGFSYGDQVLKPNEWRPLALLGLHFSGGLLVSAENADSAVGQVKGTQ